MVIAGIIYRDWLKDSVLTLILYVGWVLGQAFRSFGQRLIWVIALIIALVIGVAHSSRKASTTEDTTRRAAQSSSQLRGRIQDWVLQVRMSSTNAYAPVYRNWKLRRLLLNTLADSEKSEPDAILEKIDSGDLDLPEEIAFIFRPERGPGRLPEPRLGVLKQIQRFFLSTVMRIDQETFLPDARLYQAADYLETLLESEYEN